MNATAETVSPVRHDPALERLFEQDRRLVALGRKVCVLKAIGWASELEERFLAQWRAGKPELPQPGTQPLHLEDTIAGLCALMGEIDQRHPIGRWLYKTAWSYRVAAQMLDLSPYRAVSQMPPVRRDLSIAVDEGDTAEELGDRVRTALGPRAPAVEAVEVVGETPASALPAAAAARLGIAPDQKNVLLRVVLRDLERTLTHEEANDLRDAIYAALHRGTVWHWASGRPPH